MAVLGGAARLLEPDRPPGSGVREHAVRIGRRPRTSRSRASSARWWSASAVGAGQQLTVTLAQAVVAYDTWNWLLHVLSERYSQAFAAGFGDGCREPGAQHADVLPAARRHGQGRAVAPVLADDRPALACVPPRLRPRPGRSRDPARWRTPRTPEVRVRVLGDAARGGADPDRRRVGRGVRRRSQRVGRQVPRRTRDARARAARRRRSGRTERVGHPGACGTRARTRLGGRPVAAAARRSAPERHTSTPSSPKPLGATTPVGRPDAEPGDAPVLDGVTIDRDRLVLRRAVRCDPPRRAGCPGDQDRTGRQATRFATSSRSPSSSGIKVLHGKESIVLDLRPGRPCDVLDRAGPRAPTSCCRRFRAGVVERLESAPDDLLAVNPEPRVRERARVRRGAAVRAPAGVRADDGRGIGDGGAQRRRGGAWCRAGPTCRPGHGEAHRDAARDGRELAGELRRRSPRSASPPRWRSGSSGRSATVGGDVLRTSMLSTVAHALADTSVVGPTASRRPRPMTSSSGSGRGTGSTRPPRAG